MPLCTLARKENESLPTLLLDSEGIVTTKTMGRLGSGEKGLANGAEAEPIVSVPGCLNADTP